MGKRGGNRTGYTQDNHPTWKKGDRVVSKIACPPDGLEVGHVGTVATDFARTRMGEWSRVSVWWDYSGKLDGMLPWEIDYHSEGERQ